MTDRKDAFEELLKREQFEPEFKASRKPKKRTKTFYERTAFIALGAGAAVALLSAWTITYDKHTRAVLQADHRVSEVYANSTDDPRLYVPIVAATFLTATGSNTWTVDATFNPGNNEVDCIGCGASGAAGTNGTGASGRGGGGGAFARRANVPATPGGSASYSVAAANSDGNTWFLSTSDVLADGASGQTRGLAANSVGDITRDGGNGGSGSSGTSGSNSGGASGGSGGGAAGQNGNGSNGTNGAANSGSTGGAARPGGASGGGASGNQSGTEYDGTHGAGGGANSPAGAAGGATRNGAAGLAGGFYGGGGSGGAGGGANALGATGNGGAAGAGRQGLIVISWVPAAPRIRAYLVA